MHKQSSTNSTEANESSLVDSKKNRVLANTYDSAEKTEWFNDDKVMRFKGFMPENLCGFNAFSEKELNVKYQTAEIIFSKNGVELADNVEDNIKALDEVAYLSLGELFKFLWAFNGELINVFCDYDIKAICLPDGKRIVWDWTLANYCFAKGRISEELLVEMLMDGVTEIGEE